MTYIITSDTIDSRNIIERIFELEAMDDLDEQETTTEEYNNLLSVLSQLEEIGEPQDGLTLIRDSYFEDYTREFAEEIGAVPDDLSKWPLYCIDWEAAAKELQMDYTSVTLDGVTYWVLS